MERLNALDLEYRGGGHGVKYLRRGPPPARRKIRPRMRNHSSAARAGMVEC